MNTQTQTDNTMNGKTAVFDEIINDAKKVAKKADNQIVESTTPPNKNFEIAYALLKLSSSVNNYDGYTCPRGEIYSNAADNISKLDYPVTSGCELAIGPKKIYGIGKGVARLIDEYLNSGTMTKPYYTTVSPMAHWV